ncbi:MAG TPA: 2-phospho-L-lactate transferase CofD family protein, partial [Acidimicrobiia bacterium]|nr:2-phospho-L-lactate transferase CofD family protein [Acidimicrobiia bacterium]
AVAPAEAVAAIASADQVVLAPGSLYTSLLPVLCVRDLRTAVAEAPGRVVQVSNLRPQPPETTGLDATDHLLAVKEHGARVDTFLYQQHGALAADDAVIRGWGVVPVPADVARADGLVHDPGKLAAALQALL